VYRRKQSLKGLITSKNTTKVGDPSPTVLRRPLPFQQLKTVVDISVTWYVRHGFAIGRAKSRGNDVCNEAHKYANRVVANEEQRWRGLRCSRAGDGGYQPLQRSLYCWLYNLTRRALSVGLQTYQARIGPQKACLCQ